MRQSNAKQLQDLISEFQKKVVAVSGSIDIVITIDDDNAEGDKEDTFLGKFASNDRDDDKSGEALEGEGLEEEDNDNK